MALLRWQQNIVDEEGNVLPSATVEIRDEVSGSLVNLFQDIDGVTPKGNPLTTDSDGYGFAYMEPGRFKITATSADLAFTKSWRDVRLANDFSDLDSRINQRVIYVGSVAELEAETFPAGTAVTLTEDGRAGEFVVKSGTPPSDPQKGIFIVLANGNYAERKFDGSPYLEWFNENLQAASDAGYDTIRLSDRTYVLSSGAVLAQGQGIIGEGHGSILQFTGAGVFIESPGGGNQEAIFEKFTIIGDETSTSITTQNGSTSGQVGILQRGPGGVHRDLYIRRCDVGIKMQACYLTRQNNVIIKECRIGLVQTGTVDHGEGTSAQSQHNSWSGGGIVSCFKAVSLQRSRSMAFYSTDLERNAYAIEVYGPVYNVGFYDCWIEQAFYAVYLASPGVITGDRSTMQFDNCYISCERDSTDTGNPGDDFRNSFIPYGFDPLLDRDKQRIVYVEDSRITGTIGVTQEAQFNECLYVSGTDNAFWGEFLQELSRPTFENCDFTGVNTVTVSGGAIGAFANPSIFKTDFSFNDGDLALASNLPFGSDLYSYSDEVQSTLRVGSGEVFSSLNRALQYASRVAPYYNATANKLTVIIAAGTTIAEQILVDGVDLSHVIIESEDANVSIDRASLTTAFYGYFPLFGCNAGALPEIAFDFTLNTTGTQSGSHTGILNVRSKTTRVTGDIVWNGGRAVLAERGGSVDVTNVSASGTSISAYAVNRGGVLIAHGATGSLSQTVNTLTSNGIIYQ